MKATHNINVNGVWYKAGDEYPTPELDEVKAEEQEIENKVASADTVTTVNEPVTYTAEATAEKKTTTSRRKKTIA